MSQTSTPRPSLFARLQAARSAIASRLRTEPKPGRAVLRCETMEDRSMPAVVGGFALLDAGGVGPQQGVNGVQINLRQGGDAPLVATSDTDGVFGFGNIAPGSYSIEVFAPAGYSVKTNPGTLVLPDVAETSFNVELFGSGGSSGSGSSGESGGGDSGSGSGSSGGGDSGGGEPEPLPDSGSGGGGESDSGSGSGSGSSSASVGGTAWFDADADGAFNTNEGFAPGVGVTLSGPGGSRSTTTSPLGDYMFLNVDPGSYALSFVAPAGYSIGTPTGMQTIFTVGTESVSVGVGVVGEGEGSGSGTGSGSGSGDSVSVSLSASTDMAPVGDPITLFAAVTNSAGVPTGMVTFFADAVAIGSSLLDSYGFASFSVSTLSHGYNTLNASYFGGSLSAPVTSPPVTVSANSAPSLADPGTLRLTDGQPFTLQLTATDPDGDAIEYTATGLPAGLVLNSTTGLISGIFDPTANGLAGPLTINLMADDKKGGKDVKGPAVVVERIAPLSDRSNSETDAFTRFQIKVEGVNPAVETFTFTATDLPAGVSMSQDGFVALDIGVSGIKYSDALPNQSKVHTVVVTATGTKGTVFTTSMKWTVADKNPLQVINDRRNNLNDNVTFIPTVLNSDLLAQGFSVTATNLPAGLAAANNTIAGTTHTASSGKAVTVTITSDGQVHTRSFYWSVQDPTSASIQGPATVPGNSVYEYKIFWKRDTTLLAPKIEVMSVQGSDTTQVKLGQATSQLVGGETVTTIPVTFTNRPAKFNLLAKIGDQFVAALPLTVVQTFITNPPLGGARPFDEGAVNGVPIGLDQSVTLMKDVYSLMLVTGSLVRGGQPGIVWRGTYGAVGPNGGQGVDQIELGFIQHVKIVTQSGTYADGTTLAAQYDGQPLAGQTFLDSAKDDSPWYGETSKLTPSKPFQSFQEQDSPKTPIPLSSNQTKKVGDNAPVIPADKKLTATSQQWNFTLDFAARTLDPLGASRYFSESQVTWQFFGNGTIDMNGTWVGGTGATGAKVVVPDAWGAVPDAATPVLIDTKGPRANATVAKLTFAAN